MSETNEDAVKAIGEAVSATVASMHENVDPAVRAALEDHERDKDDLCRKLEAAIINGAAARNGLALAALREKNLRAENERLRADLEAERAERVKEWHENTTLARNNVRLKAEVEELRRKVEQPPGEPSWPNAAKMYACCDECSLGSDVKPGEPAPEHGRRGACKGVGRPTRAYRPVFDAQGNTIRVDEFRLLREVGANPSDKPAEAEKRIEALENQHLDHRLTALHEAHQALRDDVRHLLEDVGALWNSVMPTKLVERVKALESRSKLYRATVRTCCQVAGVEAQGLMIPTSDLRVARGRTSRLTSLFVEHGPAWLEVSDDNGRTWKRCEK